MNVVVLMSTYNGEKFIREQIDTILAQKDCTVSLIVRDDGSTDKTTNILQEYMDKGDLLWYTGENLGPGLSFLNMLMQAGDADYYAFSDQDDIWDQDKLAIAVGCLRSCQKPAFYCSNSRLINKDGAELGALTDKRAEMNVRSLTCMLTSLCYGGLAGCTMVLNKTLVEIIQRNGIPDKVIMHDIFIRNVCHSIGGEIIFDGRPHMGYRQHGTNVVGVQTRLAGKILSRFKSVFHPKEITVDDHAKAILQLYAEDIPQENLRIIRRVSNYRKNIFTRLSLACSPRLRETYFMPGIWIRLSLLLGNR